MSKHELSQTKIMPVHTRVPWKMARQVSRALLEEVSSLGNCTKCLRREGGFRGMVDETSTAQKFLTNFLRNPFEIVRASFWRLILLDKSGERGKSAFKLATGKAGKGRERVESIAAAIPVDQTWQFCLEPRHFRGQLAC